MLDFNCNCGNDRFTKAYTVMVDSKGIDAVNPSLICTECGHEYYESEIVNSVKED